MKSQTASRPEAAVSPWQGLYRIGGAAALLMAALTLAQFAVFFIAPPPLEGGAADWFDLFRKDALRGLLAFELLLTVYCLLSVPLALALAAALRGADRSPMALYLALSLVGAVLFIAARPAFEMLALSGRYAAAATEAQRLAAVAAGEAMVAVFHGTAFQASYLLGSLGGFILSAVMLRSGLFSRTTAWLRLASSVLDFGLFIPVAGLYISLFSVVCLLVFHILVARRLLAPGTGGRAAALA